MVAQFTIGFKRQNIWSSLAAIDFFLGGTGAGAFLVAMYVGSNALAVVGLIAVILGAVALLLDLGRPGRFWRAGSKVLNSWISRGATFTSIFVAFGVLYIAPEWVTALPWSKATGLGQLIGVIAAASAIGVMMYTGFLLSNSPAVPFWNTTMLPVLFASSALTCGTGTLFVLTPVLGEKAESMQSTETIGILLLAVNLLFLGVYMLNMNASTVAAKESARMLISGSLAPTFLGGVVGIGLVIPLALALWVSASAVDFGSASPVLAIAGILVLCGGFLFRQAMLKAGVYPPIL